ncbi:DUF2490 domain-containing protein [Ulvibacterium sp.]|uniref:DUF2490 domain-containing protein n=1 Tax=Ulvibacterium sp. TaxID=2665914 RepID=UPI003BAABC26
MCYIKTICRGLALLLFQSVTAQNFTGYWEPEVALNYKVATNYSHNFSLDVRNYTYRTNDLQLRSRHLDIAHFSKLDIGNSQSLAIGIQYRFRDVFEDEEQNELRFTQQYNITHLRGTIRFGDRLRMEQRITPNRTIHRFRYRFALDFALQGEKLDIGEPYFVASTESLLSVTRGNGPEWDQRVTTNIGWLLSGHTKFQTGLEYRLENYTQNTENVLFLFSSLIFFL